MTNLSAITDETTFDEAATIVEKELTRLDIEYTNTPVEFWIDPLNADRYDDTVVSIEATADSIEYTIRPDIRITVEEFIESDPDGEHTEYDYEQIIGGGEYDLTETHTIDLDDDSALGTLIDAGRLDNATLLAAMDHIVNVDTPLGARNLNQKTGNTVVYDIILEGLKKNR